MEFKAKVGIHNEFDIEVKDIRTGEIRQRGKAYNILLNSIYTQLCNRQNYFESIQFGRGTGTIAPTRTSLFNLISGAPATTVEEVRDLNNNVFYRKRKIVLIPSAHVGETITEVGIWGVTINSHALIQDAEGNQISIGPKTEFDEITIYATVYFQISNDISGRIKWAGLPNNNSLLNYLFGGNMPTPAIQVGQSRSDSNNTSIASILGVAKNAAYSTDIANKKINTNVITFGTTESNGDIFETGLKDIFRSQLPVPGTWDGYNAIGEVVGTGDGIQTEFNTKRKMIKSAGANIYINGIQKVNGADYFIKPYNKTINFLTSGLTLKVDTEASIDASNFKKIVDGTIGSNYWSCKPFPSFGIVDFGENDFEAGVLKFQCYNINTAIKDFSFEGSDDKANWDILYNGTALNVDTLQSFVLNSTKPYRYYKILITTQYNTGFNGTLSKIELYSKYDQITLISPPAPAEAITTDYFTECIPKNANHTLGVSYSIEWGEGAAV